MCAVEHTIGNETYPVRNAHWFDSEAQGPEFLTGLTSTGSTFLGASIFQSSSKQVGSVEDFIGYKAGRH